MQPHGLFEIDCKAVDNIDPVLYVISYFEKVVVSSSSVIIFLLYMSDLNIQVVVRVFKTIENTSFYFFNLQEVLDFFFFFLKNWICIGNPRTTKMIRDYLALPRGQTYGLA